MGSTVIAVIFALVLVLLLAIRPLKRRTSSAERKKATANEYNSGEEAALPGIIVASLAAQKAFVSIASGGIHEWARDRFSIGYIGGYTDAILQLKGIESKAVAEGIANHVFAAAFSHDDGRSLYRKYLSLKLAGDPEVAAGKHSGDSDIMSWLRNNANIPLGWSDYVLGTVA